MYHYLLVFHVGKFCIRNMGARQNHFDSALHVFEEKAKFFIMIIHVCLSYKCIYDMTKLSSTMHNNAHWIGLTKENLTKDNVYVLGT
jgi:hypothetical protein